MENTIKTLTRKRDEISKAIASYEKKLVLSKYDLAHINAAIAILEGKNNVDAVYMISKGQFKRGEVVAICKKALAQRDMTTRELSELVMLEKGLDTSDDVLVRSVTRKMIQTIKQLQRQNAVYKVGKINARCIWRLKPPSANNLSKSD